MDGGICP